MLFPMNILLPGTYGLTFLFYSLAFVFRLLKRKRGENILALVALISNGSVLFLIYAISGHWPFFNLFESLLCVTMILGLLGLFLHHADLHLPDVRIWVWLEVLLVLAITLFTLKAPSEFLYDHDYIYILLFHGFRIAALAVMLFSSAFFIQSFKDRRGGLSEDIRSHQGRNFLILSAALFLSGEYVGVIWCQKGWGDFWMWSEGFFQSTIVVLYLMLAFHLPGKSHRAEGIRSVIGGMAGFVMLILIVVRGLLA